MQVRNTLSEALPLRTRAGAIGLVLSLEGAKYYVFISRQSRDQVASSNAGNKVRLHDELKRRFVPTAPALTQEMHQEKYQSILPVARAVAATTAMAPDGRHAEESMIEEWHLARTDFLRVRGHMPRKAEVFLTHCPCQLGNNAPSPVRQLSGIIFPESCHRKLMQFVSTGDRAPMKWTVYYDAPFQGLSLHLNTGNLRIMLKPAYL